MAHTYEVSQIARRLMNEHGLGHWVFEFDKSTRRFGVCKHGQRIIGLSAALVRANSVERCTDTILHEIAHALTPGAGHGPEWVRMARTLGIKGDRCYSSADTTLVGKYLGYCSRCGEKPMTARTQFPTPNRVCAKHRVSIVWKDLNGRVVTPVAKTRAKPVYTMTCTCCGVIGTSTTRPRNPRTHRGCGYTVTFTKKSLDIFR